MEDRILIVSTSPSQGDYIGSLRTAALPSPIVVVSSGQEARQHILDSEWTCVILDLPLPGEQEHGLCRLVSEKTLASLIVIVPSDLVDTTSSMVEEYGAVVMGRPLDARVLSYAMRFARAVRLRIAAMYQEKSRLETKLDEVKLVDRAKMTLVHYLDMTEQQAHRYIEKQAMDLRIARVAVARRILKTYE